MKLIAPPAFTDNYIWMLHDGKRAVVVDPGEYAPVVAAFDAAHLAHEAILVTHRRVDPVVGVELPRGRLQGSVLGPRRQSIPQAFDPEVAHDCARREMRGASRQSAKLPAIVRKCEVNSCRGLADNAVSRRARTRGADSNEPVAALAVLRQWKIDFR